MRNEFFLRVTNLALRGLSMGSRFALILALAKLMEPAELGLYGLLAATISFAMLVIGADYYTYSQRELLGGAKEQWSFVIQHQVIAQAVLYLVLIPFTLLVFLFELIPVSYLGWFLALLIFEHIAQEINRLLVVMHKQLTASWILFLRTGLWVWIALPLMWMFEGFNNIVTVLAAWLVGVIVAIILAAYRIYKEIPVWRIWPIDKVWIAKGFKVGSAFLIATMCFKGLLTFDRYAVQSLASTEQLGVYVFYIGLVMGLMAFLDPAVFSFLYPRLVQAKQQGDESSYKKNMKELLISTLVVGVVLSLVSLVVTPYIIDWIDKPIYQEYLGVFHILILGGFVFAIGHIPHYGLYASKNDRWIISAHVASLSIFVISLWFFSGMPGLYAVAYALLIAFTAMAAIKQLGYTMTKTIPSQSTMTPKDCINDPIR